jgi:integrase
LGQGGKTQQAIQLVLKNFLKSCKAPHVQDVTAHDVAAYWQYEVDNSRTHSYRTAHNRVTSLGKFLKAHKLRLIGREDDQWSIPPYDEEIPEVYEDDEIELLFGGSDARHRAAYSVMLKALFCEGEAMHLAWPDVDAKKCILRVRSKPEYGWRVKKYHERDVTVPRELIEQIMALPKNGPLVFAREDGQPDGHLLRDLKAIAKRVGIDPGRVWLHKFRATGCTRLLQRNMPLPDVMRLGGWRDLASVQRYMGLLNHDRLTAAVEKAWA